MNEPAAPRTPTDRASIDAAPSPPPSPTGSHAPSTQTSPRPAGSSEPSVPSHGLSPAHAGLTDLLEPPARRRFSARALAIQVVGIAASIALLSWAIVLLLAPENRANLERILEAPPRHIAALAALSVASLAANGLIFWCVLRPVRRLHPVYLIGVNSIATFLSVLPFKLNLATRVLIHHRRDAMPFREIIAWMAAMAALAMIVMVPAFLAGVWRGGIDALWAATIALGAAAGAAAAIACGRFAAGHSQPARWLARLSMGSWRIVRHPSAVLASVALRAADIAILAARFVVAAGIIGHALPWETAIVFGSAYFILSVVTPSGSIGVREGGVIGLGSLAGHDLEALASITLIVSAAELLASGALALIATAIIRPDRLLQRRSSAEAAPSLTNPHRTEG